MKTISIGCMMCGRKYDIEVEDADYEAYKTDITRTMKDIFPYLTPGERKILGCQLCEDCMDGLFSRRM